MGVGAFANCNQKDMTMIIWWRINSGEESEKFEKLCIDSEKDEELYTHDINFVHLGEQPVKVCANETLTCLIKLKDADGDLSSR